MKRAAGVVLVLATWSIGCSGADCYDVKTYSEQGSGEATTTSGTAALMYQPSIVTGWSSAPDPSLTFIPSDGVRAPSLTMVAPVASGIYSLTDLDATVCDENDHCTAAQGLLVYTLRPKLASYEFEAQLSFYAIAPAGQSSAVTGSAQITTTEDDAGECTGGDSIPLFGLD